MHLSLIEMIPKEVYPAMLFIWDIPIFCKTSKFFYNHRNTIAKNKLTHYYDITFDTEEIDAMRKLSVDFCHIISLLASKKKFHRLITIFTNPLVLNHFFFNISKKLTQIDHSPLFYSKYTKNNSTNENYCSKVLRVYPHITFFYLPHEFTIPLQRNIWKGTVVEKLFYDDNYRDSVASFTYKYARYCLLYFDISDVLALITHNFPILLPYNGACFIDSNIESTYLYILLSSPCLVDFYMDKWLHPEILGPLGSTYLCSTSNFLEYCKHSKKENYATKKYKELIIPTLSMQIN
jgi:hypothetical protein